MYVCIKTCFLGSLYRVGDIVLAEIAGQAPMHFDKIQARTKEKIDQEIEEKIPEIKKRRQVNKPISAKDYLKSQHKVKIAGE